MEDRSKRTETVRPQFGERCEKRPVCVSALIAKSDENDVELNGETDDEDMEDGETGFDVRTVTNARQVGMRMRSKCTGTHRHARVDASNAIEKREQTGKSVRQVAQAMEEQLREPAGAETAEEAKRIRGIVHENDKIKGTSHVQDEMGKLMHHDERGLLSLWEGWHWDDRETEKVPIKTGWAETDKRQPGLGCREQSAGSAGSRVVSWNRTQTLTGEATKPLDDRCQLESS